MVPTRLNRDFDGWHEMFQDKEAKLSDFLSNDKLADVTLINPITKATYQCHRVVLASGSKYLLDVFAKFGPDVLKQVKAPQPFNQKSEIHSDDQVSRILKYLYNSQSIDSIKEEVTEQNYYSLYAQAFALKCEKLLQELTQVAIECLLNENNVCHMFHDAIEHQDTVLAKACADLLVQRFETAQEVGKDRDFLLELDLDSFVSILQSDKLNIIHENALTEMVKEYFNKRKDALPHKELPPEQALKPELWALLDETEKANRKTQYEARQKAEQDKLAAARDEQSKEYQLMDTAQRIQFVLDLK